MWGQWGGGLQSMQMKSETKRKMNNVCVCAHVEQQWIVKRARQMAIDLCQFEMVNAVIGQMVLVAFNRRTGTLTER